MTPDPMPPEEAKKRLAEVRAAAEGRTDLLTRCALEMEAAAWDFDVLANRLAERAHVHPFTLTPKALRELVDEIRREQGW